MQAWMGMQYAVSKKCIKVLHNPNINGTRIPVTSIGVSDAVELQVWALGQEDEGGGNDHEGKHTGKQRHTPALQLGTVDDKGTGYNT